MDDAEQDEGLAFVLAAERDGRCVEGDAVTRRDTFSGASLPCETCMKPPSPPRLACSAEATAIQFWRARTALSLRPSPPPRSCRRCSPGTSAREPVLAEAAGRFAAAIKARDHLAVHVDDLALGVDAQPGAVSWMTGVAQAAIERRLGDLVERRRLAEIARPRRRRRRNCSAPRSLRDSAAASARAGISSRSSRRARRAVLALKKKPAAMSTFGGFGSQFSRCDRIAVEDRPDRTAAVVAVADAGHRRVEEVVRVVLDVLGVALVALVRRASIAL